MVRDCAEATASTDGKARPRVRLGLGLALLAAILSGGAQAAGQITTPMISGLAWRSGAKLGTCLAALRGRALDVNHIFITHSSFPAMVKQIGGGWAQGEAKKAPLWLVSLPLLTSDTKGQFAACQAGAFDTYWSQIGANILKAGAQQAIVRLGWEANIGSDSHPWGVDSAAQIPAYIGCWRRAATLLKAGAATTKLEWTNAKKTDNSEFTALDMYPGDDVVDVWGVHYYDSGPLKNTQALWDQYYNATYRGGPWGLGAWLAQARAHGKPLGVGEWGVWQQRITAARADDPVYVDNMFRFFKANAVSLAYESYHNSQAVHTLCPSTRFPNAAARYRLDWGGG